MSPQPPEGAGNAQARHNIKTLRAKRGMSLRHLAARLDELGHPILVSALGRLETGGRRLDVDDLLAIAVALNTSPLTLLLPPGTEDDWPSGARFQVTPTTTCSPAHTWWWATGWGPLCPGDEIGAMTPRRLLDYEEEGFPQDVAWCASDRQVVVDNEDAFEEPVVEEARAERGVDTTAEVLEWIKELETGEGRSHHIPLKDLVGARPKGRRRRDKPGRQDHSHQGRRSR